MDTSRVFAEDGGDFARVGGAHDEARCGGFADFDVVLEHGWVGEAEVERGDGHCGGDGAKVEDGLVFEEFEVVAAWRFGVLDAR